MLLYGILLLIIAVSLYSSQLVLNTLWVEDFGNFIVMGDFVPLPLPSMG